MAGRVASPRASTATRVGPWPSTPIATTSATSAARSARTALTTADHHAPGSCSAQPWPPDDVERVAAPGERQEATIEGDQAGLDLGRAEVEAEDGRLAGGRHTTPLDGAPVATSSARTASAVATSVTSVRTTPARSAPEDRADLALAGGHADRDRETARAGAHRTR